MFEGAPRGARPAGPLHRSFAGAPSLTLTALIAFTSPVTAQTDSDPGRWGATLGAGAVLTAPDVLERDRCGDLFGLDFAAGVGFAVSRVFTLETSLGIGLLRPTTCVADTAPEPEDGVVTRRSYEHALDRNRLVSTRHRVLVDLTPGEEVGLMASLGGGRVWTHGAWFWSTGLVLRVGPPGSAWFVESEVESLGLGYVDVTRVLAGGTVVSTSTSAQRTERGSIWTVRYRRPIG